MPFATGYDRGEAELTLALCELSYIDEKPVPGEDTAAQAARMRKDIDAALATGQLASWQVAWGPGLSDDRANMMYVAGNQAGDQYAAVIRGTDWSFWMDWLQDLASLLAPVPYPYANDDNVRIAVGTNIGLSALARLTGAGPAGDASPPVTLDAFLKQLPDTTGIFVTGHSLGGCLASVVAPWLSGVLGGPSRLKVYTFAAPSAGNAAFAAYYNALFTDAATGASTAFRVYNSLDVVPNAWASLPKIETYYTPSPHCPDDIRQIVNAAVAAVGTTYAQVGTDAQQSSVKLTGQVILWQSEAAIFNPIGDALFAYQVAQQHKGETYQKLLGSGEPAVMAAKVRAVAARLRAADGGSGAS